MKHKLFLENDVEYSASFFCAPVCSWAGYKSAFFTINAPHHYGVESHGIGELERTIKYILLRERCPIRGEVQDLLLFIADYCKHCHAVSISLSLRSPSWTSMFANKSNKLRNAIMLTLYFLSPSPAVVLIRLLRLPALVSNHRLILELWLSNFWICKLLAETLSTTGPSRHLRIWNLAIG